VWYLDIGTSNHMCGHKHLFIDIQRGRRWTCVFWKLNEGSNQGRGKIFFSKKNGKSSTIEDMCYVLDLKNNILSIR